MIVSSNFQIIRHILLILNCFLRTWEVRIVVSACAMQRRSARAGGECNWEKFNCVVWSKQTEAAIPALERDFTGRFITPQTKSDWTTGIWPESFSSLSSESNYYRYKGPFRWGINSVHGVVPHVGFFSSKQMWRTRLANAMSIQLVLLCNNGCVSWSASFIQLCAFKCFCDLPLEV